MARRYGGKYSPAGEDEAAQDRPAPGTFHGASVDPVDGRANALFLPAVPLVFFSLNDGAVGLTMGLAAAAILTLAAYLLREGLRAEAAYDVRRVAKRPAIPRKLFASALTGIGTALAAYKFDPSLAAPVLYGLVAAGLHGLAFGIDPLKDKNVEGVDSFQHSRVARVVTEAEAHLATMTDAIAALGDRALETRIDRFAGTARSLFRVVEDDPRDLTAARKYLTVYLQGARDASVKYAELATRSRSSAGRADFVALLDDLEQNFAARTSKLMLDDRSDLTVEIDVLRDRLRREGVTPE